MDRDTFDRLSAEIGTLLMDRTENPFEVLAIALRVAQIVSKSAPAQHQGECSKLWLTAFLALPVAAPPQES